MNETKACKKCNLVFPIERFHFSRRNGKDYRRSDCYKCKQKYQSKYKQKYPATRKDPNYMSKYLRNYMVNQKKKIVDAYGGKCTCCGEPRIEFMTIEHIGGWGTEHRKTVRTAHSMYRWIRINNYPKDKITILCYNCNLGGTRFGRTCPHKTEGNIANKSI